MLRNYIIIPNNIDRRFKKKTYLVLETSCISSPCCCRCFNTLRWLGVITWLMSGFLVVVVVAVGCYGSGGRTVGLWLWWLYCCSMVRAGHTVGISCVGGVCGWPTWCQVGCVHGCCAWVLCVGAVRGWVKSMQLTCWVACPVSVTPLLKGGVKNLFSTQGYIFCLRSPRPSPPPPSFLIR